MSVENFDGDGLADQPSIIYSFETDDADDIQIRELARSGFGSPDSSSHDVIERESTNPRLLFGCRDVVISGETTVVMIFQCSFSSDEGCGSPVYVGRTCASPVCERDWPAAMKTKTVRTAGKIASCPL